MTLAIAQKMLEARVPTDKTPAATGGPHLGR